MAQGEYAILFKNIAYYEDLSKFGKLGQWILSMLCEEEIELEQLIGEMPGTDKIKKELTEEEKELIQLAKSTGLKYKITSQGVKITS